MMKNRINHKLMKIINEKIKKNNIIFELKTLFNLYLVILENGPVKSF